MEISWFFLSSLYYFYFFSFDNDVVTFFKEGVVEKTTILFVV